MNKAIQLHTYSFMNHFSLSLWGEEINGTFYLSNKQALRLSAELEIYLSSPNSDEYPPALITCDS
jgi:hypothetical protein